MHTHDTKSIKIHLKMKQFRYPLVLEWKINHDIFIHTMKYVKTMKINRLYATEMDVAILKRLTCTCFFSFSLSLPRNSIYIKLKTTGKTTEW